MVYGIGTDLVNIKRIEAILTKYGNHFVTRILHEIEREKYYQQNVADQIKFLAKRFAAKEAVAKAFGTGIGNQLSFQDIAVVNDDLGAPKILIFSTKIPNISSYNIHISISDELPFAIAFVVISK